MKNLRFQIDKFSKTEKFEKFAKKDKPKKKDHQKVKPIHRRLDDYEY